MFRPVSLLSLWLLVVVLATPALAEFPTSLPFQAVITDSSGEPVGDNTVVTFSIYNDFSAGTMVWGFEDHTVTPEGGIVSVMLGSESMPLTAVVFTGESLWLQISLGSDHLTRIEIGTTAYAFRAAEAGNAQTLDGNVPGDFATSNHGHSLDELPDGGAVQDQVLTYDGANWGPATPTSTGADNDWTVLGNNMTADVSGNVGIGVGSPTEKLDVAGNVKAGSLISTVPTGTAPLTVVSSTKVNNLNVDELDGMSSDEFAVSGHSHAELESSAIASANRHGDLIEIPYNDIVNETVIDALSVTVPGAGYVLALATVEAAVDHQHYSGASALESKAEFGLSSTSSFSANQRLLIHISDTYTDPAHYRRIFTINNVFPVSGPGVKTFYLLGRSKETQGGRWVCWENNITLMYIPVSMGPVHTP